MSGKKEKAGVRLYEVFLALGWTKVKASQELGVSENMIYKYCNMETFSPHLYKKMVGLLKRKYNVNPDYISSDSDEMFLSESSEQESEIEHLKNVVEELQETLRVVAEETTKQTELIQQLTTLLLKSPKT